ncbi:MAG: hypothetical protein HQL72_13460 [Magnetococcales bacterium]|nr:hypothetical protein [Magnetococcales bacterium]
MVTSRVKNFAFVVMGLLAGLGYPELGWTLTLGQLRVVSHDSRMFHAEIPVALAEGEQIQEIWATSGSQTEYEPEPTDEIDGLMIGEEGERLLIFTGKPPSNQDFFTLLVRIDLNDRSLYRNFPVHLDATPPVEATSNNEKGHPPSTPSRVLSGEVVDQVKKIDRPVVVEKEIPVAKHPAPAPAPADPIDQKKNMLSRILVLLASLLVGLVFWIWWRQKERGGAEPSARQEASPIVPAGAPAPGESMESEVDQEVGSMAPEMALSEDDVEEETMPPILEVPTVEEVEYVVPAFEEDDEDEEAFEAEPSLDEVDLTAVEADLDSEVAIKRDSSSSGEADEEGWEPLEVDDPVLAEEEAAAQNALKVESGFLAGEKESPVAADDAGEEKTERIEERSMASVMDYLEQILDEEDLSQFDKKPKG